jgi:asparagine synthase (glutamine-hydrolysing)
MCGIAGMVARRTLSPNDLARVDRMSAALAHRGPDGPGEFHDANVALGVRRLSIIDPAGGAQPLYNEDRSLVLIANGEIYNFIELRAQLEHRGHRFRTGSDCETILHLYEDYDTECVQHLRGMFVFALWDGRRHRLLLARDRMGEKPLYLYERDGELVFSSELKSLMCFGRVPFVLDPIATDLYFHYQFVPEPATPIRGVRKLAAAHVLALDVNPWRTADGCYWRMENAPPCDGEPVTLIQTELERLSELVIRSDVPVGVALSGGLDSSAVAALASAKYPGILHAFSVGYPGRPSHDERLEAKALADYLAIPFHEAELHTDDMVAFFPELVYWRDDPIADISGYGYYAVAKLARDHGVPVLLQGQGGDELFWGYSEVRQAARESLTKRDLPDRGWSALLDHLEFQLPDAWSAGGQWRWFKSSVAGLRNAWQRYRRHRLGPPDRLVFYDLVPDFQLARHSLGNIYTRTFLESLDANAPFDLFTIPRPWSHVEVLLTRLICETYLAENGITQGDRLSMASSVELRLPLLDYRLVETVIGLRKSQSDLHLAPKAWLKTALKGILPDWVMDRPKRGFEPPVQQWHQALFATYGRMLEDGYLVEERVIRPASGRRLARGPFPREAVAPLSFKALVLEMWCRRFSSLAQESPGNQ